jgi:hypothetical protein
LLQLPGAQPPSFPPIGGRLLSCAHAQHGGTSWATFRNRHGDQ